jgi:hypothetical protein
MARWKLTQNCTLPIDGVVFEQRLTTNTGRPATERWPAHQLFMVEDPPDPSLFNDEDDMGIPICCVNTKPYKRDFVIDPAALRKGWVPNPGMEPLDAEARALTAKAPKNSFPMGEEAFPTQGTGPGPRASDNSAILNALAEMNAKLEALAIRNAELEELLRPVDEPEPEATETVQ